MYLNLNQIAESFGVSEKVVEGWIRYDGLPHTPDRGRVIFDRAQVAEWAASRGLATKAGFLAPVTPLLASGSNLESLLRAGGIWRDVSASEVPSLFERIVAAVSGVSPSVLKMLAQRLAAPGGVTIAPVGGGFAFPHPSSRIALGRESGTMALILLRDALVFDGPRVDDTPVTRLLFFIAPSPRAHLDILGRLSRMMARGPIRELVARGASDGEIYQAFSQFDAASAKAGEGKQ